MLNGHHNSRKSLEGHHMCHHSFTDRVEPQRDRAEPERAEQFVKNGDNYAASAATRDSICSAILSPLQIFNGAAWNSKVMNHFNNKHLQITLPTQRHNARAHRIIKPLIQRRDDRI